MPEFDPAIWAASQAANNWYESVTGKRNPSSAQEVKDELDRVTGGLSSYVTQGSGSPASQASSAVGQSSLDDLMKQLQSISAENTQLSAQQAEALRKWQEVQNAKAMEFNASEATKSRDWTKMMSDTAHQREVKDLQAAGLNPVLSAMGGQGAAVGSAATASGLSSSGAKGDVDTSRSSALVQLLSSALSAQTALTSQAMSARSNEAIAERNNATSQLVAMLTGQYKLADTQLSGEFGLSKQWQADTAAWWRAKLSEEGALDRAKISGEYGLSAQRIAATAAMERLLSSQGHDIFMAQNYPNNWVSGIAAILGTVFGGKDKGTGEGIGDMLWSLFGTPENAPVSKDEMKKAIASGDKKELEKILEKMKK